MSVQNTYSIILKEVTEQFIRAYAKFTEADVDTPPKLAGSHATPKCEIEDLDTYTREHYNTVLLIKYLRRIAREVASKPDPGDLKKLPPVERLTAARAAGHKSPTPTRILTPTLAALTADALEKGWKSKPFTTVDPAYLRKVVGNIKKMLAEGDADAERLALALGATMNKKAAAAKAIAAHVLDVSGFDGRLYRRSGRNKKG